MKNYKKKLNKSNSNTFNVKQTFSAMGKYNATADPEKPNKKLLTKNQTLDIAKYSVKGTLNSERYIDTDSNLNID